MIASGWDIFSLSVPERNKTLKNRNTRIELKKKRIGKICGKNGFKYLGRFDLEYSRKFNKDKDLSKKKAVPELFEFLCWLEKKSLLKLSLNGKSMFKLFFLPP